MGVKLRISAPGLAMNKFRHEQINVLPLVTALPTPRLAEFIAHVPERLVDRPIERRLNQAALVGVAYRPERRHVLRHAEAEVYGHPTVGLAVVLGKGLAGLRMVAIKEPFDVVLRIADDGNLPRTELFCPPESRALL